MRWWAPVSMWCFTPPTMPWIKGQKPLKRRWPTGGRNNPEITVLGIHENQKEAEQIATVECKGVTFAMLNYTAQINGEGL